jgi:hypothetical protein
MLGHCTPRRARGNRSQQEPTAPSQDREGTPPSGRKLPHWRSNPDSLTPHGTPGCHLHITASPSLGGFTMRVNRRLGVVFIVQVAEEPHKLSILYFLQYAGQSSLSPHLSESHSGQYRTRDCWRCCQGCSLLIVSGLPSRASGLPVEDPAVAKERIRCLLAKTEPLWCTTDEMQTQ